MTPEDHAWIAAAYADGATVRSLALEHGTTQYAVRAVLAAAGALRAKRGWKKRDPVQMTRAIALYRGGYSVAKVAYAMKRDYQTVMRWLHLSGVKIRGAKLSQYQEETITAGFAAGWTQRRIAKEAGCSRKAVEVRSRARRALDGARNEP